MGTMHPAQEQLVAMTREMIERATAGDWEAVAREEAERRRLLAAGALDPPNCIAVLLKVHLHNNIVPFSKSRNDNIL